MIQSTKINPTFKGQIKISTTKKFGEKLIEENFKPINTTLEQDKLIQKVANAIPRNSKAYEISNDDSTIFNTLLSLITGKKINNNPGKQFMKVYKDKFIMYMNKANEEEGSTFFIKFK